MDVIMLIKFLREDFVCCGTDEVTPLNDFFIFVIWILKFLEEPER